jgi:hypothetical protein
MQFEVVSPKLDSAVRQVLDRDRYLLEKDINEPAISHRLAVYLEAEFEGFNVDCEYNGNVDADSGRKYIHFLKTRAKQLGLIDTNAIEQELVYRSVFPDIIVHKRGQNGSGNNLLVIEVKKSSNRKRGDWDAEKLSRFTSSEHENRFDYDYGAFVRFTVGAQPSVCIQWYQNGQNLDFDLQALYAALDDKRQALSMTWSDVARAISIRHSETPGSSISASTITGIRHHRQVEADGVLQMLHWLDRTPESFGAEGNTEEKLSALLPPIEPQQTLRFDVSVIYAALEAKRTSKDLSWKEVAQEIGGCAPGSLTRLAKGGRVWFPHVMRVIRWTGKSASEFMRASDW